MAVYLDYNATTPLAETVREIIAKALVEDWANPGAGYAPGKKAANAITVARNSVAAMLHALPDEVVFTSGATESNNMVIQSIAAHFPNNTIPHVISSQVEHDSVLEPLKHLHSQKRIELTLVETNIDGSIEVEDVLQVVQPNTSLISIMLANNETGVIFPIKSIASQVHNLNKQQDRKIRILLHTDAAQAIGKIEVNVQELGVDFLSLTGHKFYGPRSGALFIRKDTPFLPLIRGGGQENGLRPGTPNTPYIMGLGEAARLVTSFLGEYRKNFEIIKCYLKKQLKEMFNNNIQFNCENAIRHLPNTLNISLRVPGDLSGSEMLGKLSESLYASVGATCHSANKPSEILLKSHVSLKQARRSIRLSLGRETTFQDINNVVSAFKQFVPQSDSK